jgi:hypothetical protein
MCQLTIHATLRRNAHAAEFSMQSGRKRFLLLYALIIGLAITCCSQATPAPPKSNGWTLVWSDEFNGPNGSPVDRSKWVPETGGDGWGNHELEYYTDRIENASIHDGNLVVKAISEKYTGPDGVTRNYTSARLKTCQLGQLVKSSYAFDSRTRVSSEMESEVEKEKRDVRRPSHNSTSSVAAIYTRSGYSEGSTGRRCVELS